MTLKCIIVDDESLARKLVEENIRQLPFLDLVGICKNPFEAMQVLQDQPVDLIFLDIQMPGMLGTKFLQGLREKPMVIFITAYSNYAVESYDLDVIDYLLKPVSLERFTKACYKALDEKQKQNALASPVNTISQVNEPDFIFVNSDYALVKVILENITHIESMKDYIKIYVNTATRPVITKITLKSISEKINSTSFLKVHKSFIVNLQKIESIKSQNIVIGSHNIPVSDAHTESLMRALNQIK
jgi:DNA-binding LytR/AlgR family response regulator